MTLIKTQAYDGKRIAATLIDYVAIISFFILFVMSFGEPNNEGGKTVSGAPALIPVLFWFTWLVIPEAVWGTTLGHHLNNLKIISMDGEKPSFGQVLKRRLCDILEISWCFGLIAFVLVRNTRYNQRLGDIWGKTLVVDKKTSAGNESFEFETEAVNPG